MVDTQLAGAFPRSEKLIAISRSLARGKATQTEFENALYEDIRHLTQLQTDANVDELIDGQLNWQDLFRPFSELFTGIRPGSLTRWFDNNTFYRKPVVEGRIDYKGEGLEEYFHYALLGTNSSKKAVLPGPYTFARLSEDKTGKTFNDLIDDFAHALRDISRELTKLGYKYIQYNEPALGSAPHSSDEMKAVKHAYETIVGPSGAGTGITTYFSDVAPIIPQLLDISVDRVSIDFYATSLESIDDYKFDKALGCGCIDGRNSLVESASDLSNFITGVADRLAPRQVSLQPNCDLDFLPKSIAEKKTVLLREAKELVK